MRPCEHSTSDLQDVYLNKIFSTESRYGCRICWLYYNDPAYKVHWGGELEKPNPFGVVKSNKFPWTCKYSDNTKEPEKIECAPCLAKSGNKVEIKVFECSKYGKCQVTPKLPGIQSCRGCVSWEYPEIKTRNLLYHLFPKWGNDTWKANVARLLPRLSLFNGKKLIAVMVGPDCAPAHDVIKEFKGAKVEFKTIPNNPSLREVASFDNLFGSVETKDPTHVTVYAHSKGIRASKDDPIHRWVNILEEVMFDHWPYVEEALSVAPIAGSFLRGVRGFNESQSEWHYSGTFFAFRNKELFTRDWKSIDRFWSGMEAYPGKVFKRTEAACLFHPFNFMGIGLYNSDYVTDVVLPDYEKWKKEHVKYKGNIAAATAGVK